MIMTQTSISQVFVLAVTSIRLRCQLGLNKDKDTLSCLCRNVISYLHLLLLLPCLPNNSRFSLSTVFSRRTFSFIISCYTTTASLTIVLLILWTNSRTPEDWPEDVLVLLLAAVWNRWMTRLIKSHMHTWVHFCLVDDSRIAVRIIHIHLEVFGVVGMKCDGQTDRGHFCILGDMWWELLIMNLISRYR